jgi:small subunit ribosomal protein S16
MVKIRLRRMGAKGQPSYRIVASEKESPRDGRFLEILGSYNPRTTPATIQVNEDRVYHWMSKGAQPSESVVKLFRSTGLLDRYARFKQGETLEALLAEATATVAASPASSETSAAKPSKK